MLKQMYKKINIFLVLSEIVFILLISGVSYSISIYNKFPQHLKEPIANNSKLGFISAFPKPYGILYDNRAFCIKKYSKPISLFPKGNLSKNVIDINELIINKVIDNINKINFHSYNLVKLPPIEPNTNLTGFLISSTWGSEAKSIDIIGLNKLMKKEQLPIILAIVPATYEVSNTFFANYGERVGLGFDYDLTTYNSPKKIFYFIYTMFLSTNPPYKKIITLNKQVIKKAFPLDKGSINQKNYPFSEIINLHKWVEEEVSPIIAKQATCFLGFWNKSCEKSFIKPITNIYYYLPH